MDLLRDLLRDINKLHNDRIAAAAKADPEKYKLCLVMDGKADFNYYTGGRNGKGQRVYHCFTTVPNVAGYYLYFYEKHSSKTVRRTKWKAFKSVGGAQTYAMRQSRKTIKRTRDRSI